MASAQEDEETDDALVARYRMDGSEDAFARLLGRHGSTIYAHLRHIAAGRCEDVDSVYQMVWTRVIATLRAGRYEPRGTFRGWLVTMATRICRDEIERTRRRRMQRLPDESEPGAPGTARGNDRGFVAAEGGGLEALMGLELVEAASAALATLPTEQREVFVLHFNEGMKLKDIALSLGIPEATVRSRFALALAKLRGLLARFAPGSDDPKETRS